MLSDIMLPAIIRRSDTVSDISRPARVRRLIAVLGVAVLLSPAAALANTPHKAAQTSTAQPTATAATTPASGGAAVGTSTTNPLSGGVSPVSPAQTPTTTSTTPTVVNTSTAAQGNSSLSTGSALAVVIVAVLLIGGIAYFIRRDARKHAPVRAGAGAGGGDVGTQGRRTGSKAPPKARKLSAAERKRRKRGRAKR